MNIPNILTTIRFFMIPLYVLAFCMEGPAKYVSALIFILASATDVLDGYIARKYNMVTKWGQLMDPLADKLMQLTVIISLVVTGIAPVWFIVVVAAKELLMIVGSTFLYAKKTYVKANVFGKLNTVVIFLVVVILLVFPESNPMVKNLLLACVVLLSLLAMISYVYSYFLQQKKFKNYIPRRKF